MLTFFPAYRPCAQRLWKITWVSATTTWATLVFATLAFDHQENAEGAYNRAIALWTALGSQNPVNGEQGLADVWNNKAALFVDAGSDYWDRCDEALHKALELYSANAAQNVGALHGVC